jgi:hypothetical protein
VDPVILPDSGPGAGSDSSSRVTSGDQTGTSASAPAPVAADSNSDSNSSDQRHSSAIGSTHEHPALYRATWGYVRPEKRTAGRSVRCPRVSRCGRCDAAQNYSNVPAQRPAATTAGTPELAETTNIRPAAPPVRDEKAAGSNPATPGAETQVVTWLQDDPSASASVFFTST